jgi:hypothetical protein
VADGHTHCESLTRTYAQPCAYTVAHPTTDGQAYAYCKPFAHVYAQPDIYTFAYPAIHSYSCIRPNALAIAHPTTDRGYPHPPATRYGSPGPHEQP